MKRFSILLLLFSLSASLAGRAQSIVDSVFTVNEVTVTGSRVAVDVVPVQVLSGEELQRLSAVSVADAIRYFSGVQIKDYGGIGGLKTVDIRSLGSQHVGVFYDGVQLGNAQNGQIDLGRFSLDNMESIAVYNGQRSVIFQSAKDFASAGAVYMTARRPEFAAGRRDNLRLSLRGGSFGTVNPSLLWEHRLGDNLDAQLGAEYMYTTGKYRFTYSKADGYDTTQVRHNGDVRALRAEGGLFGRLRRGDWRAKIYFYDSERGYPGASVREEPGKFRNEDRQWDRNIFVQGSLRQFYGRYNLMVNAKYANDRLHYVSDPRLDAATMYVDNVYRQQEVYLSAANEYAVTEWWHVSLSSDIQYNTLSSDMQGFVRPSRTTSLTAAATALELGHLRMQGSLLYTHVRDRTRGHGGQAGDRNEWTPSVIASWRPLDESDLSIRAFCKRIFRMPTLNDLYYTLIGNARLDPEYTTQYDLGVVYGKDFTGGWLRRVEVQADGYFNRVRDKIIAMPSSNQFRWTMLNMGYVEIRGVDMVVRGEMRFGAVDVHARLNYTWQRARDFTDPDGEWYGGQIPYMPRHSGSAVVGTMWKGWGLNYSFIYVGERYESSANIPENHVQPWYTHDMSISRVAGRWHFTVEVNNIFDQQYEVIQCYPMPGTNLRIKIDRTL